ncbi:hypothetical protein ACGFXC_31605 [Streptomyces sp. NPDC048507]|uniref:hypothetical protein n=1 Tax=Streptomyces sp. NPDC048507 TaxID=3365560 RepID=UPI0037129C34
MLAALSRVDEELGRLLAEDPEAAKEYRRFVYGLPERTRKALEEHRFDDFPEDVRTALVEQLREQRKSAGGEAEAAPEPTDEQLAYGYRTSYQRPMTTASGVAVQGAMAFQHPAVARNIGYSASLAMGGISFSCEHWRLKDNGYPREWIKNAELWDILDMALALQAELQLQCLLTDREFTRLIETRGAEFEWLKAEAARRAAEEAGGGFWGFLGDVLGVVSAVAGVLALIPVLTPIAGPIAAVTAIASLGAHTVDAAIKGDWDAMTIVGLGADALAALPGVGAVAKGLKAGRTAMKTIGTGAKAVTKASVVSKAAGRSFLATTGGTGASEASAVFNYLGTKGAKAVGASTTAGKLSGKVLQGSVNLSTQVPVVVEMTTGADMADPKNVAAGSALTANYGQSIGNWGAGGNGGEEGRNGLPGRVRRGDRPPLTRRPPGRGPVAPLRGRHRPRGPFAPGRTPEAPVRQGLTGAEEVLRVALEADSRHGAADAGPYPGGHPVLARHHPGIVTEHEQVPYLQELVPVQGHGLDQLLVRIAEAAQVPDEVVPVGEWIVAAHPPQARRRARADAPAFHGGGRGRGWAVHPRGSRRGAGGCPSVHCPSASGRSLKGAPSSRRFAMAFGHP